MGVEKLRLGLATVGSFAVPPSLSTTVDGVVGSSRNGNVGSRDTDKRTIPLLVTEGCLAAEDKLRRESVTESIFGPPESWLLTLAPS
jgi:hypothetical protein